MYHKNVIFFIICSVYSLTIIAAHQTVPINQMIEKNTGSLLQNIKEQRKRMHSELDLNPSYMHTRKVLETYLKKNPYAHLNECVKTGYSAGLGGCPLNRIEFPYLRAAFEDTIVTAVTPQLEAGQPLHLVSFASGDLFQDLMIVTHILKKQPSATIDLHCIDAKYALPSYTNKLLDRSPQFNEANTITPNDISQSIIKTLQQAFTIPESIRGEAALKDFIAAYALPHEYRLKAFMQYIKKRFPESKVQLYTYGGIRYYMLLNTDAQPPKFPDVIYTNDIDLEPDAIKDYKTLCTAVLKKQPKTKNYQLTKQDGEDPEILSFVFQNGRIVIHDHPITPPNQPPTSMFSLFGLSS